MKKRIFAIALVCTIILTFFAIPAAHADPPVVHQISNCDELQHAGDGDDNYITQYEDYVLTNDINCSGIDFVPLEWNSGFKGNFDGQGHTIYNLTINQPGQPLAGLFLAVNDGSISNLTLSGGSVTGAALTGAVAADVSRTNVTNVHSNLDVTGTDQVGGLFGAFDAGEGDVPYSIEHSSSSGHVTGGSYVGGLAGLVSAYSGHVGHTPTAYVKYSWATGDVDGTDQAGSYIGGLIGFATANSFDDAELTEITDSFASGNVDAPGASDVGGLIGDVNVYNDENQLWGEVNVMRTYATGDVTGGTNVGGLIGNGGDHIVPGANSTVSDSFAVGHVTGPALTSAGLIGYQTNDDHNMDGTDNYFDPDSTGQTSCGHGQDISSMCTAISATDFPAYYFDSNRAPMNGNWDFAGDPWFEHPSTYPTLTTDDDFDGVDTSVEEAAPNNGDGNNDGTLDSQQSNVTDLHIGKGDWGTVILDDGAQLLNVSLDSMDDFTSQDNPGYEYQYDFIDYSLVIPPHASTFATIYYFTQEQAADLHLRKYNKATNTYADVPNAVFSDVDINGEHAVSVRYIITDGDEFDSDGSANGIVNDPVNIYTGGPIAVPTTTTPGVTTTVVAAPKSSVASASGSLPTTGSGTEYAWIISAVLLISGAGIVAAFRRRRLLSR